MKEKLDELFEKALNKFDFETVRKVMKFMDWKWWGSKDIPTFEDMEQMCRELYAETLSYFSKKQTRATISSGGFSITIFNNYVGIEFVIEKSSEYEEEEE